MATSFKTFSGGNNKWWTLSISYAAAQAQQFAPTMGQPFGTDGLRYLRSALAVIIGFVSGSRPGAIARLPVGNLRVVGPQMALLVRTETKTTPNTPLLPDAPGRRPLPLYFRDTKVCSLLTMYIETGPASLGSLGFSSL